MITAIISGFSLISKGVQGFFGLKKEQTETIKSAINVLSTVSASSAKKEAALASVIAAEASSGYWLAAVWRPMLMIFFATLLGARWFGYMPPDMTESEITHMYGLLELGIGGYIGSRGLEKIVSQINITKVLSMIGKK